MFELQHVEERLVRCGDLNMRLLINRSHGYLRFMDYRVGNYEEKCNILGQIVMDEGLRKIFTLVEKSDSNNWKSAGFCREGVYPSFFRTADAYMMSRLYSDSGVPLGNQVPIKSEDDEQKALPREKLSRPNKIFCEVIENKLDKMEVLNGFDGQLRSLPFGRAGCPDVVLHGKAQKQEVWACAEIEDSFGHAIVGFAPPPKNGKALSLSAHIGAKLVQILEESGVGNVFGICPSSDRWSNELFRELNFKITGQLAHHLLTSDGSSNATLWHYRLIEKK